MDIEISSLLMTGLLATAFILIATGSFRWIFSAWIAIAAFPFIAVATLLVASPEFRTSIEAFMMPQEQKEKLIEDKLSKRDRELALSNLTTRKNHES